MKRNIYQKLLMSLAMVAFLGTLTSAQVLSRSQVDAKQIQTQQQTMNELKAKAKAQGLKAIPTEWLEEKKQANSDRLREASKGANAEAPIAKKKAIKKPNVERKIIGTNQQNIYERAKQITPPPGYKVGVHTVGGKQYIEFLELPDQGTIVPVKAKN